MTVSIDGFNELSDRQQKFLLDTMTDPETGTRAFSIDGEISRQVWFERLLHDGWVELGAPSQLMDAENYEIPFEAWDIIAEVKASL